MSAYVLESLKLIRNTKSEKAKHFREQEIVRTEGDGALIDPQDLPTCRRLIVLVPDLEINDQMCLPRHIWELATRMGARVLYLSLARDYEAEMKASRRLAELAAITRDRRVAIETRIFSSANWAKTLKGVVQDGDMILVQSEQKVSKGLAGSEALSERLARELETPLRSLTGFFQEGTGKEFQFIQKALSLAALPLIIGGFFAINVFFTGSIGSNFQPLARAASVMVEISALLLWNNTAVLS